MRRPPRSGRIDLAALFSGLLGGALVAAACFAALLLRESRGTLQPLPVPQARPVGEGDERAQSLTHVAQQLASIEQRLARIESAQHAQPGVSERAAASPPDDAPPLPATQSERLREQLDLLGERIDQLAAAWKERVKPSFELPTIQQVRAARRPVDWAWLGGLAELCLQDESAANEKARLLTFDQLLQRAGVPDGITHDDGTWMYLRPQNVDAKWRGIYFHFVGDSVSSVRTER
ncbi:MAG: hypothetical protein IPJ19_01890 [Planctomycetes bacterium]|nr:hypothetical protein [Planctomycetota bacterium]